MNEKVTRLIEQARHDQSARAILEDLALEEGKPRDHYTKIVDNEAAARVNQLLDDIFPPGEYPMGLYRSIELDEATSLVCRTRFFEPTLGMVGEFSLGNCENDRALVIVPRGEMENPGPRIDALRAAVEALRAPGAAAAGVPRPLDEVLGLPVAHFDERSFAPSPSAIARRQQSLDRMSVRFDAVAAYFKRTHGLRLPRHLAVWAAFWDSLDAAERDAMDFVGRSPGNIAAWFEDGGLHRRVRDGLDVRLNDRFRFDPPELVTVAFGDSDGLHYGLWYDDPAELPSFVAANYARDSAECWRGETSVIQTLRAELEQRAADDPDGKSPRQLMIARALEWFTEADEAAIAADGELPWAAVRRPALWVGIGPALAPEHGAIDILGDREEAYRQRSTAQIKRLAEVARRELGQDKPACALVVGQELHHLDESRFRKVARELLVSAYEALGRDALAQIARLHYRHRDLRNVGIYEADARLSALEIAALEDDADEVKRLLGLGEPAQQGGAGAGRAAPSTPKQDEIQGAVAAARSLAVLDPLLDLLAPEALAAALSHHLDPTSLYDSDDTRGELVGRLLDRGDLADKTFPQALDGGKDAVIRQYLGRVSPDGRTDDGTPLLNLATRAGRPEAVRELLARGADPTATNRKGLTALDEAREVWTVDPHCAADLFALLKPEEPGPEQPPEEQDGWVVGARVRHSKFGTGKVKAVKGSGENTKLDVRFGSVTKTLLARFVSRIDE
jgi:hypothetical protein